MTNVTVVLDMLENLEVQWSEFTRRVGDLAGRFEAIAGEGNLKAAANDLEAVVDGLLEVCRDYPYIAELLRQAEGASPEPVRVSPGIKRPPSPDREPTPDPKEIANRYYSLLAKLKETNDQIKEDANDRRTYP